MSLLLARLARSISQHWIRSLLAALVDPRILGARFAGAERTEAA